MSDDRIQPGAVVQISPECKNRIFAGCLMTVSERKGFGAQGYVQMVGTGDEAPGGLAYVRINWADMAYVGMAEWVAGSLAVDDA